MAATTDVLAYRITYRLTDPVVTLGTPPDGHRAPRRTAWQRLARHVRRHVGATRLVRISGIGMIAAGAFVMDPADGFPLRTPDGVPASLTWQSYAHVAAGSVTFTALIAACFVMGHHFGRGGERRYAIGSRIAGTALLLGNGWAMSGGKAGTPTLAIGVITAMTWISVIADRYRRNV